MTLTASHALASPEVLKVLGSDALAGLSPEEAARRLAEHGPNTLPETEHRSLWRVLASQFASPLIYILFVAAAIAFAMGKRGDSIVILVVVIILIVIFIFHVGADLRHRIHARRGLGTCGI